jgi:hypothetical protein
MILPVAVVLLDPQVGLTGPSSKGARCFCCYLQEIYSDGFSSAAGIVDLSRPGEQKTGAARENKNVGNHYPVTDVAEFVNAIITK